jgi:hypothetical protein
MIICATGAGIPQEVEESKAVHYSLPERAEPCNVHTTGTADETLPPNNLVGQPIG